MRADCKVHRYAVAVVFCKKKGKQQCIDLPSIQAEEEKEPKVKQSAELWRGVCSAKVTVQSVKQLPKHARGPSSCTQV